MTKRMGDLTLSHDKVGGWKFSEVNDLMNFKFPKIEKLKICFYLRTLYSELRMLFYLSNIIPTENRVSNLSIRFEIYLPLGIMSSKFSWLCTSPPSPTERLSEEWTVRRNLY